MQDISDISPDSNSAADPTRPTSKWRSRFKVHPAADVFPMLSDEELAILGEDIKNHGLTDPILLRGDWLVDGRNRLEAIERAGLPDSFVSVDHLPDVDVAAFVISKNLRRRHMTKAQIADAIVALAKIKAEQKPDQVDPVSGVEQKHVPGDALWQELVAEGKAIAGRLKGGRGKKNPVKAAAVEINKALPKEDQVSEPPIKRAIAKGEGKTPRKRRTKEQVEKDNQDHRRHVAESFGFNGGIEVARMAYLAAYRELSIKAQDKEWATLCEAMREIARERLEAQEARRQAKAVARDTEAARQAAINPDDSADLGNIPPSLDRRR
jgi:ParB-like chromosome segregation protein Spo0J